MHWPLSRLVMAASSSHTCSTAPGYSVTCKPSLAETTKLSVIAASSLASVRDDKKIISACTDWI